MTFTPCVDVEHKLDVVACWRAMLVPLRLGARLYCIAFETLTSLSIEGVGIGSAPMDEERDFIVANEVQATSLPQYTTTSRQLNQLAWFRG